MTNDKIQDLNLCDNFLFASVMSDAESCRGALEIILGVPIAKVQVDTEHTILYSPKTHGIRLDVIAVDEAGEVKYNIEMQVRDHHNLPKRSRFYQAEMDMHSLAPGKDYNMLPRNIIIFICTYPPFESRKYRYTFLNRCIEEERDLEDGTLKIFLFTQGENAEEVPAELVKFLTFVENSTPERAEELDSDYLKQLADQITELKKSWEWEVSYMKFQELLNDERQDGLREGQLYIARNLLSILSPEEIVRYGGLPEEMLAQLQKESAPEDSSSACGCVLSEDNSYFTE